MFRPACILIAAAIAVGLSAPTPSSAGDIEPGLRLPRELGRTVALTLDACSGATDHRILDALVDEGIPATLFVTHRWLRRNADTVAVLLAHPELFEIEDHGEAHVPAITDRPSLFGIATAGTLAAVDAEVLGGNAAIETAFGHRAGWFRGATARYSRDAAARIGELGFRIAGYSLNADVGASLPALIVERRIAAAKPGDVIIAHVNQPTHASGEGVIAGVRQLRKAGFTFVKLDDAFRHAPGS